MRKSHQISLEQLTEWLPTARICFASSPADQKRLYVTAYGKFQVEKEGDIVLETDSDFEAVEMYNDL